MPIKCLVYLYKPLDLRGLPIVTGLTVSIVVIGLEFDVWKTAALRYAALGSIAVKHPVADSATNQ